MVFHGWVDQLTAPATPSGGSHGVAHIVSEMCKSIDPGLKHLGWDGCLHVDMVGRTPRFGVARRARRLIPFIVTVIDF